MAQIKRVKGWKVRLYATEYAPSDADPRKRPTRILSPLFRPKARIREPKILKPNPPRSRKLREEKTRRGRQDDIIHNKLVVTSAAATSWMISAQAPKPARAATRPTTQPTTTPAATRISCSRKRIARWRSAACVG